MKILLNGCIMHTSKDWFETGCELDSTTEFHHVELEHPGCLSTNKGLIADNEEDLIAAVREYFSATLDEITINACDEPGRIDVQIMTRLPGFEENSRPSKATMEKWKNGEMPLYLKDISFFIEDANGKSLTLKGGAA